MSYSDWEPVIGLEVHAQLNTKTKIFSSDSAQFGAGDNENTNPVSLGLPGALPVINKEAIRHSVRIGHALNCDIRAKSVFSRKNYFYPDLPKGYQISQFDEPLCENGKVEFLVEGKSVEIGITRAHMEEDSGKSIHHGDHSLINLNRAGVPLLEIVSEPDIRTPEEAANYARTICSIVKYLDACDGNMEEGSLRCDCNVSVRKKGADAFGTKVEIKNINSFRFVEKAIEFEIQRQIDVREQGGKIVQETRLFDSTKNKTYSMRAKEDAHDYRYFPEPDLLPVVLDPKWIEVLKVELPELPLAKARRLHTTLNIPEYDAVVLSQDKKIAMYFEVVAKASGNPKASSNWIMGDLMRELKESKTEIDQCKISSANFGKMIQLIDAKTISGKIAKTVFAEMWETGLEPNKIIEEKGLVQISDAGAIEILVDEVIKANPAQVEQYRGGKDKLFGFFVGQIMKASKGKANPELVNRLLKEKL